MTLGGGEGRFTETGEAAATGAAQKVSAADLYCDLEPSPAHRWSTYIPGLTVALAATLAAAYLADHYGAPLTLMALLIGLALNFLGADRRLDPGLMFASRTLLRWGIVLVGLRVTLAQIVQLGPSALLAIMAIVATTLFAGLYLGRRLGFSSAFGVLAGGAVAICGASAAMALFSMLGERRVGQAQLTVVLVGVSALSALAMFAYPIFAHLMGLDDRQAGFLLGAAIHDVAQSVGAGYAFSPEAGDTAVIVKLTRVSLLAPVLAALALFLPRGGGPTNSLNPLPWFVVGFFVMAAINSFAQLPAFVSSGGQSLGAGCLACAVTATGMRSQMQSLLGQGARPLLVIVGATGIALVLSIVASLLIF